MEKQLFEKVMNAAPLRPSATRISSIDCPDNPGYSALMVLLSLLQRDILMAVSKGELKDLIQNGPTPKSPSSLSRSRDPSVGSSPLTARLDPKLLTPRAGSSSKVDPSSRESHSQHSEASMTPGGNTPPTPVFDTPTPSRAEDSGKKEGSGRRKSTPQQFAALDHRSPGTRTPLPSKRRGTDTPVAAFLSSQSGAAAETTAAVDEVLNRTRSQTMPSPSSVSDSDFEALFNKATKASDEMMADAEELLKRKGVSYVPKDIESDDENSGLLDGTLDEEEAFPIVASSGTGTIGYDTRERWLQLFFGIFDDKDTGAVELEDIIAIGDLSHSNQALMEHHQEGGESCQPPKCPVDQASFVNFFLEDLPTGYGLGQAEEVDFEDSMEAFLTGAKAFVKRKAVSADEDTRLLAGEQKARSDAELALQAAQQSLSAEKEAVKRAERVTEAAEDRLKDERKAREEAERSKLAAEEGKNAAMKELAGAAALKVERAPSRRASAIEVPCPCYVLC